MVGAIRWLNVNASHFMRCQRADIDCVRAGKVNRDHGRYHRRDLPNSRASVAFTRATMTARSSEPARIGPVASSIASGDPASRRSRLRAKISLMRAARSPTIALRPNCVSGPSKRARTAISTRVAAPPCSALNRYSISALAREALSRSLPAPRIMPRCTASSRITRASPLNAAAIGPSLMASCPCSRSPRELLSVAPGMHGTTRSTSAKKFHTSRRGRAMTKDCRISILGFFPARPKSPSSRAGGRVIADGSSERHRSRASDRPAVARAHRTKPPWLDRRCGESAGATLLQHAANGAHDADISGAAAKVAAQLEADAPLVGSGETADDVARRDQHSRRAESALQTVLGRERLPQRGHDGIVLHPFDGRDLRVLAKDRIGDAGSRRLTVDQQRARTARALLAAQMRAGQSEPFAQQVGEVHARLYRLDDGDAVYGEAYGSHLAIAEAAARVRAVMWRRAGVVSPARPSNSLAALSSRPTAAPGRGTPPKITRASAMTTGRPCVAPMAALKRSRSQSSNTAPLARANSPALRHTL